MIPYVVTAAKDDIRPIFVVEKDMVSGWLESRSAAEQRWIADQNFKAEDGRHILLPGSDGGVSAILFVRGRDWDIWSLAGLPSSLPKGTYRIEGDLDAAAATDVVAGWSLGTYAFDRYKKDETEYASLVMPSGADEAAALRTVRALTLVRDLINIPAGDLGPAALEDATSQVAGEYEAEQVNIVGDDLLTYHFPMVHAVGRASDQKPRLVDMIWGDKKAPKVTLVGKGVCFDTGGLDIKSAAGMILMKKDMGGAANVLGLAQMIMDANLPVRLRVLIPAVENAISGNAFRPSDILKSRSGKTVEIGNTDAEGRLILADALTAADEEEPDLLIDMATLTGAARVAVGTELSATFTDDNDLYAALEAHGKAVKDAVWRMPLWDDYRHMLDSKIADINNTSSGGYAGAITAALFLKEFVKKAKSWVHFDIMGYNTRSRPGRPVGGEAFAIRALFAVIKERYGN
ncbi:MAG: leucyl aminopeptidase family protein [Alphaproteobacteria bacterium]|nr:MAG: leucyl aminopeptidase family protein [Alphaproteobacteria bacterium]